MIKLTVNGKEHIIEAPSDTPLLWILREKLRLTGTKYSCGRGICGSCTVHINKQATRSCITPISSCEGQSIETIESKNPLHPIQEAWIKFSVPQCGYCQSGQIMQAISTLENTQMKLNEEELMDAMSANLCRCGTYPKIKEAIVFAAKQMGKLK